MGNKPMSCKLIRVPLKSTVVQRVLFCNAICNIWSHDGLHSLELFQSAFPVSFSRSSVKLFRKATFEVFETEGCLGCQLNQVARAEYGYL